MKKKQFILFLSVVSNFLKIFEFNVGVTHQLYNCNLYVINKTTEIML